jgi:hypothetical protein
MNKIIDTKPYRIALRERGIAVLPVTLILLFLITIITIFAARVGILETRTSSNKVRYDQAFSAAEFGVQQGIMFVQANANLINDSGANGWVNGTSSATDIEWAACSGTAFPCGDGTEVVYDNKWLLATIPASKLQAPAADATEGVAPSYILYALTPCRDSDANNVCDSPLRPYNLPPITLMARGTSPDGTSNVIVKEATFFFRFGPGTGAAPVPLMAPGTIGTSGNFNVVTNPDGGGDGVPLSAWSNSDITVSSSAATCQLGTAIVGGAGGTGFLGTDSTYQYQTDDNDTPSDPSDDSTVTMCRQCVCNTASPTPSDLVLTGNGVAENYDILDVDSNVGVNPDSTFFPSDMFEYVFGVPTAQYDVIKSAATVLANCSSLNTSSRGLYWITGNCQPAGDVGSYKDPVLLVVEGTTKVNSNNYLFGMIFAFTTNPSATLTVDLNGTPTIYGAILSNGNVTLSNGNYKLRFDTKVLANLQKDAGSSGYGRVAGSWVDYHNND